MQNNRGFIALIAVIMIFSGTVIFSLTSLASAVLYADSVNQREIRIQARLNAEACLDTVKLMSARDYFLEGTMSISEFGCTANIYNDMNGHLSVEVVANLSGVSARAQDDFNIF